MESDDPRNRAQWGEGSSDDDSDSQGNMGDEDIESPDASVGGGGGDSQNQAAAADRDPPPYCLTNPGYSRYLRKLGLTGKDVELIEIRTR